LTPSFDRKDFRRSCNSFSNGNLCILLQ
jgi:hypothetical protein